MDRYSLQEFSNAQFGTVHTLTIGDELDYSERQVRRLENLALRLLCVPDP